MKKLIYVSFALLFTLILIGCGSRSVTVSFVENGGVDIEDIEITQQETLDESAIDISRVGYSFKGWYEDEALTEAFSFDTLIVRNITLYAKWEINQYTITFEPDNGDEAYIITDDYATLIDYPEDPSKTGYGFVGWFLEETGETEFEEVAIPGEDLTVYAIYTQNEYVVNFYLDEDDTEPTYSENVFYGEDVLNPPAIPVVTGKDGSWSENITNITSDLDVYIIYTTQTFDVTFETYDGIVYSTQTYDYGSLITPPSTPERTGYDFIGYYNDDLERNIDLSTFTVTESVTLQDNYQIQIYTVNFYGGENGGLLKTEYVAYNNNATPPTDDFDRLGYTFTGWSETYLFITGDLDIYAEYAVNVYPMVFDANGGKYQDDSSIKEYLAEYNANMTVPEVPTRDGFVFVGWFTDLNDDQTEVYFATGISMPIGGLSVYAKWVELVATRYTVSGTYHFEERDISADQLTLFETYTAMGSEVYTPFVNILYGTDMSPVRDIEGYVFDHYVYNGETYYDASQLINITENTTVDVYYKRVVLTVSFSEDIDGSVSSTTYYVYYNESITNVPTPTPVSGYTVQWERLNFDHIKTSMNIAAIQYDNSLQTITFVSNDSIIYIATNTTGDAHAIVLDVNSSLWSITQEGYKFLGWFIEGTEIMLPQGVLYYDDSYFSSSNVTRIEARWVELDPLNEADNIDIDVDLENETIEITFDVLPTLVNGLDVYPFDFTFILNGTFIDSSLLTENLMDYIVQTEDHFVLTLTSSNPFYTLFAEKLVSEGVLISGTHTLQIISIGDDESVISSEPSAVFQYEVKSIYDDIPESQTIKDYYIIEDFGNDTLRYIFYTNLSYQFNNMTFNIETGTNHITADGSILSTSDLPGEFTFTITDESGTRTYAGLVVQDIRQFNLGSSYQNYLVQTNASLDDDLFLKDSTDLPYLVGNQNSFYLDILIRDNYGSRIGLDEALLNYTFYLNDAEVALDEATLATYLTLDNNIIEFTEAAQNQHFRIVVEPRYEALKMDMNPIEYNILVNDGYNAFTNADLKTLFSDMSVSLINIHRDITAELSANQMYEDGSPKNFYATPTNDYTNYGNVYYRVSGNTDDDQIQLEGNFMTIDGSDINYINPDLAGNGLVGYSEAFEIVSVQIAIFYYNVYETSPINNNQFSMNNLRILGNTTTPSINYGGTEEEIYNQERLMSQNSGGMGGITIRSGKADLNNLIIGYTTIGVTTNAYGENSLNEVLTTDLDYVSIYDSWANSVYLWGGSGVQLTNSLLESSGGAAIHFDDSRPGTTGYNDPILIMDDSNEVNNWVSGQEAWFKAYAMSSVALALKSNINAGITSLEKTIIQLQENPVTGLETEMFNLVFLAIPNTGAVTYENPNDETSVITASEVEFSITDATGTTHLERPWDFTESGDPRMSGGQYGFALGSLSETSAFLNMISEIMTIYYTNYGVMMDQGDAGNLASIAGFYNLTATEVLQVAGAMQEYSLSIHEAIVAVKGSLDYAQPKYIEVVAPITLGGGGNATVLIEIFNRSDE